MHTLSSFFAKAFVSSVFILALFTIGKSASAATSTVCGSGCDFISIQDAAASSTSGNVFSIESTYSSTTETFPISNDLRGKTIDCQSSGAVIGNPDLAGNARISVEENTKIQNCSFGNIVLFVGNFNPDGIVIANNIFSRLATSTILFDGGMDHFTIINNQNIGVFSGWSEATSTSDGLIQNNTFYIHDDTVDSFFGLPTTSTNIQILSNTFESALTPASNRGSLVDITGTDISFASNTVHYLTAPSTSLETSVYIHATGTMNFFGNKIEAPPSAAECKAVSFSGSDNQSVTWNISYNTIKLLGGCSDGMAFLLQDKGLSSLYITANYYYNALYAESSVSNPTGLVVYWQNDSHSFLVNNDYNGFYGFTENLSLPGNGAGQIELGSNTFTSNPFFRVGNISTTDDFDLAPFSGYLDVNGTQDIGAVVGVRDANIDVNAAGTINYTSVDATSTVGIGEALRSGDMLNLSTGTYAPIAVSSTRATTTISVTGIGNNVIIDGTLSPQANGIQFTHVTSSSITNITIQNASSTGPASFSADLVNGVYNGQSFDESFMGFGIPASSTIIYYAPSSILGYTTNDTDVTALMAGGYADWHVAMAHLAGSRVTLLVPGYFANSAAGITGGPITVDAFATSTFVYNSGDQTFTFNPTALSLAGITLDSWVPPTPELSTVPGSRNSGIRLNGSHAITMTHVTSTNNGNGVSFDTDSSNNLFVDSSFSGSTHYDINYESNARNIFDNVSFVRTSSTFSGSGDLLVKFDARAQTTRVGSGIVLANVSVTSTDSSSAATFLGTTDAFGYTSYVSLPAYLMSALSIEVGAGGYNSYTFRGATSTYQATSLVGVLQAPNSTFSIAMYSSAGPSAPLYASSTASGTSTATLAWVDTADDEEGFIVQARRPLLGEVYPGFANAFIATTTVVLSGLTPGETYEFRVAAVNSAATSTFVVSPTFIMAPVSAPPFVSVLSDTSFSAAIDSSTNATSVQYALYSSTLGGYLTALGGSSASPVWQASSTWATATVSGLSCDTAYSVVSVSSNTAAVENATSSPALITTSACAVVSSGGSGGGGAIGLAGSVQTIFNTTPSVIPSAVTGTSPLPPQIVNQPVVEASAETKAQVLALLRTLKLSASVDVIARIARFVQYGTNSATRALGSGERLAVFKDACETMGRADVPSSDLERMAGGEIPKTRSLGYEQSIAPRALVTFQNIFGKKAPDFKNERENLAWNTLMYRIRFPRDLKREAQGIQTFKTLFLKNPSDSFQWSVVRVLGYVK